MGLEAVDQAFPEIGEIAESQDDTGMARTGRSEHSHRPYSAKPDHSRLEQLLPERGIETAIRPTRQLDLWQRGPLGAEDTSAKAMVLGHAQILG